jgi:hypothetical protein
LGLFLARGGLFVGFSLALAFALAVLGLKLKNHSKDKVNFGK